MRVDWPMEREEQLVKVLMKNAGTFPLSKAENTGLLHTLLAAVKVAGFHFRS